MIATGLAVLVLTCRVIVLAVFAFAGVAKLRDRDGTWSMLRAFGASVRVSDVAAPALPWLELGVALALVPTVTARAGAIAAIVLLAAFTAAIVANLARGRTPECRCFGAAASAPIGPGTVARNVLFMALAAGSLVWSPATSDPAALSIVTGNALVSVTLVLGFAIAVQAFFLWQLLVQQGRIMRRLDDFESLVDVRESRGADTESHAPAGLPVGAPAPDFQLADLTGTRTSLAMQRARGRPVGLFFLHSACGPCRALVPHLVRWSEELAQHLTLVVISSGEAADNRDFLLGIDPHRVLLQSDHEVADLYRAYGTPAAVIVDAAGKVASSVAGGRDAIATLLGEDARIDWGDARPANRPVIAIGTAAPEFEAPTSDGLTFRSSDLRGSEVTLVFWSPQCGFCRQAADDVVAWERDGNSRLVVLSTAPDPDLVARGLRHPIVIDEGTRIGALFGATGTPMAVRISAAGLVASTIAAGRDAIAALMAAASAH